jgi:DNA polymerase delta subunit 1
MLMAWKEFMRLVDPDIITGYNIVTFDFPYILQRASNLGLTTFPFIGRLKDVKTAFKETTFTSRVLGTRETKEINLEGRIQFDMLQFLIREHKLRSYTLNSVSAHFLGEQKEDVHYSIISQLQEQDEYSRRRLAIYCIKDAYLPLHLLNHLQSLINTTEIARVCGIPLSFLFTRGQQIKVTSQLYRKCKALDFLIPTEVRSAGSDGKFEGAVVLEPTRGYYTSPVAVLDFASLYPSIMMAHNLCYSTLIPAYKVKDFDVTKYERTPNGDYFVKKSVTIGVLPQILEDLITARKLSKEQLKNAENEEER